MKFSRKGPLVKSLVTTLAFTGMMIAGQAQAEHQSLDAIKAPSDLKNIHVIKLGTDKLSTDFVIFVKNKVPLHKHDFHTETLYVLEGSGDFQMGEQMMKIAAGDYIRIPEGTPHAVTVTSDIPLKVISVQAPEFLGKDRVMIK
ncbi:MAG: cupin domain-containing protein [Marinobacterium sp.]|nr:cupin domain-containing protein [Marinobacterium sp.]